MFAKLRAIFDLESSGRLLLYSALVGVVAGLGGAGFYWGLNQFQQFALGELIGYTPPPAAGEPTTEAASMPRRPWAVVLVPTLGGLVCGLLVYSLAPEAEGHGTDSMVRAFHRLKGLIRPRAPIVKAVASILTIGSGGSAGREGPIAQIGAGFGSFLAQQLRLDERHRRVLVLAGAAGGVAAVFRAPLGGALFAVEVLYSSMAIEFFAIVPCVVSAVLAYSVFSAIYGPNVVFATPPNLTFHGVAELPFYLGLAVVCSVAGYVYVATFYGARDRFFRRLPIPRHLKPALGGLMLGAIALVFPQVISGGYGWIQQAIDGPAATWPMSASLMASLVVAKIVATSATISSGGSGGVFAPSLFIGAMLGGAFGQACHYLFPAQISQPEAFVLVGMGGFFAGVAKVPLTAILMVCEMSGSYNLLVPLMLVSALNVALLSRRWTLYEEQVANLVDSPAHFGDFVVGILEQMTVRDVCHPGRHLTMIPEDAPLARVLEMVARSNDSCFPVVDGDGRMVGLLSLGDLRSALVGPPTGGLVLAADVAASGVPTVTPDDNLLVALRRFAEQGVEELPVVEPADQRNVICLLRREEVIRAYDRRLSALRSGAAPPMGAAAAASRPNEPPTDPFFPNRT